jgi:hypothetical protein
LCPALLPEVGLLRLKQQQIHVRFLLLDGECLGLEMRSRYLPVGGELF